MTSFQQKSAISRKEFEEKTPNKHLGDAPKIQIPYIPMPPIHPSQSLSPNILLSQHHKPLQTHSQSLSPTVPTTNRDRKRLRDCTGDDNKDPKRRKLSGETALLTQSPSKPNTVHGVPPPSALTYNTNRPPSISTDNNDNAAPLNPIPLNSAASNCSSISRTSPSITSSEPNQSTTNTKSNDNNKEIHLALQNLASLVAKNNHNTDHIQHNGASLLLLPTQQTSNTIIQSMSSSPNNSNNTPYNTLGLRIPNIDINSMNNKLNNSIHKMSGSFHSSTDRINQFIFGGTPPVQCNNNNYAVNNGNGPLPQPLQSQLLTGMDGINGNITMNDIDTELQKEMNKREMRKIIAQQLDNLRQQMLEQEREDEAKLQALKFMKLMQSTQINQKNKLAINYSPNSNIHNQHFTPTLAPLNAQQQKQPLPLPQFLQIPQFNASNVRQTANNRKAMFLDEQKQIISDHKTRSNITPMLSGYKAVEVINKASLPSMADTNKWNDVFKRRVSRESKYLGHGRETIIAATGKIQPRKDMDESQCALLCNLMVELCFTEGLNAKICMDKEIKHNMDINTLKIDPEICLNMNLNTNTKMNGFSSMIGHSHCNNISLMRIKKQSAFNIVPPTFQQTSTNSMPGLEDEVIHNLTSSSSDSSSSSSSDEFADKFKSDSEDEPIEQAECTPFIISRNHGNNDEDIDMNEDIEKRKENETSTDNAVLLNT